VKARDELVGLVLFVVLLVAIAVGDGTCRLHVSRDQTNIGCGGAR